MGEGEVEGEGERGVRSPTTIVHSPSMLPHHQREGFCSPLKFTRSRPENNTRRRGERPRPPLAPSVSASSPLARRDAPRRLLDGAPARAAPTARAVRVDDGQAERARHRCSRLARFARLGPVAPWLARPGRPHG
eukprot:scaffold49758_cov31-Tisochrysis_lutea.AAC.2